MPAVKVRKLEEKHGDLHQIIPPLVNEYGQWEAGKRLGVSGTTLSRWLRHHGYRLETRWIRDIDKEQAL